MTTETEIRKRSVTRDDAEYGGVYHFHLPFGSYADSVSLPPDPPAYWSRSRDARLRTTVHHGTTWPNAVSIAISKMASLAWEVSGPVPLRVRRAQDLLHTIGAGNGWVSFLSKHLRDFLTCDNGAFVEVVRASSARGSRIIGLMHLDSLRCERTGDSRAPVIYTDKRGKRHELRDYQVIAITDMPNPGDDYLGVGLCAASRAYEAIVKAAAIDRYFVEKITGNRPTALHFVQGVSRKQLEDAFRTSDQQSASQGYVVYKGAVMIPVLGDTPAQLMTVPIAEVPDGFDAEQERQDAARHMAGAIGIDPQDLDPNLLASRALGTGAQSLVIAAKEKGRGLAAWRQAWTHMLNEYVLPASVTFEFVENDARDEDLRADVTKKRGEFVEGLVESGLLTRQQGKQYLVDWDELPKEFLPSDETPDTSLGDDERPGEPQPDTAPMPDVTEKQARNAATVIDEQLPAARALFLEVTT
jgi:hypothetical protein